MPSETECVCSMHASRTNVLDLQGRLKSCEISVLPHDSAQSRFATFFNNEESVKTRYLKALFFILILES